jgi:signal recognition particle receptor subunit beta
METLEFIIYPDGRVKETVTGIVGSSCQEVTAAIEQQLGVVVDQKQTSDYYAQNQVQSATTVAQSNYAQSNYSDW